jgi:N-acetylglucosamine-6-phosphate deacetylase
MIFENQDGKPVEVNQGNFKQILRGTILGSGLTQVEFLNGTIEWLKATDQEILKRANQVKPNESR